MNKHLARGCVSLHFFFHGTLSNVEKVRMQIDFFTIAEETCAQKIAVAFAKMNKHTDFKQTWESDKVTSRQRYILLRKSNHCWRNECMCVYL